MGFHRNVVFFNFLVLIPPWGGNTTGVSKRYYEEQTVLIFPSRVLFVCVFFFPGVCVYGMGCVFRVWCACGVCVWLIFLCCLRCISYTKYIRFSVLAVCGQYGLLFCMGVRFVLRLAYYLLGVLRGVRVSPCHSFVPTLSVSHS